MTEEESEALRALEALGRSPINRLDDLIARVMEPHMRRLVAEYFWKSTVFDRFMASLTPEEAHGASETEARRDPGD